MGWTDLQVTVDILRVGISRGEKNECNPIFTLTNIAKDLFSAFQGIETSIIKQKLILITTHTAIVTCDLVYIEGYSLSFAG